MSEEKQAYHGKSTRRRKRRLSPAQTGGIALCVLVFVVAAGGLAWYLLGDGLTLPALARSAGSESSDSQSVPDQEPAGDPDDDPARWLTGEELDTAQGEALSALVEQRKELCLEWLSAEETERLTPTQMFNVATQRKELSERKDKAAETLQNDQRVTNLETEDYDALLSQLSQTSEEQWDSLIEQAARGKEALTIDAEASLKASGSMAWLTGDERTALIEKMVAAPKSQWAAMIREKLAARTADQSKLQSDAAAAVDAADTAWLTSSDRTALINKLIAADRSKWNGLISTRVGEKTSYLMGLAKSAVKAYKGLGWLTGDELTDFLKELADTDQDDWRDMMDDKESEKPTSSSSSEEEDEEDEDDEDEDEDSGGGNGDWGGKLKVTDTSGRTVSGSAYDIVAQVVQNEVGSSFHSEAIKAQAVAAYTFIKYENDHGRTPSHALATPSSTVKKAVSAVEGEAVYYKSNLAFTPFFSASNGATNSSKDVWGGSYAYLVSVDSSVDEQSPHYGSTKKMSEDTVRSKLESYYRGIDLDSYDPSDWFEVESYTDGDYNGKMRVGNKSTTGRVLRESVLGLKSSAFEVEYDGSSFIFTTYGYGHGVGLSQYGAHYYAKDGWSYTEILEHYYSGCTVR